MLPIPAVVQTSDGVILAFAEGRVDGCNDCAVLGIAMKRSLDGGISWSNLTWPVPPTPTGEGYAMDVGGNPTVVFDSIRQQVVLHFNRGMTDPQNGGTYDCIPAVDNFQITSPDYGLTWSAVKNISSYLEGCVLYIEDCFLVQELVPSFLLKIEFCSLAIISLHTGVVALW